MGLSGKTKIEDDAERLLLSYGITLPSEIDLEAIAWDLGVRVRYGKLDGCEARIIGNSTKAIVRIDSRVRETRQRFSLGHELGHWRFDRGKVLSCTTRDIGGSSSLSGRESRANIYASSLIMPRFMVSPFCTKRALDFRLVDELCAIFGSSREATASRLIDVWDIEPAMLVVTRPDGQRHRFARSRLIPKSCFPHKMVDSRTMVGQLVLSGGESMSGCLAADCWLSGPESQSMLFEDAVRWGKFGYLSLLSWADRDAFEFSNKVEG